MTLQPGSSLPSSLSSGYGFHNLLGAMYLQMYRLVAAGEKPVARCHDRRSPVQNAPCSESASALPYRVPFNRTPAYCRLLWNFKIYN